MAEGKFWGTDSESASKSLVWTQLTSSYNHVTKKNATDFCTSQMFGGECVFSINVVNISQIMVSPMKQKFHAGQKLSGFE